MEKQEAQITSLPYKFKELKVYSSTEWLAENRKKYRQVFDRASTTFVYTELSFYNKRFDEENWDVNIVLKCFNLTRNKKEVCNLDLRKKVSKYDHTVYIREGWGNKKIASFWSKGTYYWEAWVDSVKVATKYFYVEEIDELEDLEDYDSKYLALKAVKLYEGKYDDVSPENRKYFKVFGLGETRYIYAEIKLANLNQFANWQCEIFVKFFNQSRELKGQVTRLVQVKDAEEKIDITAGWGANIKGSWRSGMYSVEVVFMDRLLGVMPFEIAEDFVEGVGPLQLPNRDQPLILLPEEEGEVSMEEIMIKLNSLIGLNHIKQKVQDHAKYLEFIQLRKDRGFKEDEPLSIHAVFTGNPGTGKTTVARMMGKIYRNMGLLSRGHVHEVDRVNLVGEYIGQTAPKVKEAIDKARGGILFIDEAYALARANDDTKDFGREVIEILVKEMSDGIGDLAIIVAGYPEEMNYFLQSNPGLRSRFKISYQFDDYLPGELNDILKYTANNMDLVFDTKAENILQKIIVDQYRSRDRSFGNARFVYDLAEKAKINLGLRVMNSESPEKLNHHDLSLIKKSDVENLIPESIHKLPELPIDESLLKSSLLELDQLIGLQSVKKELKQTVELVRYYQSQGLNPLQKMSLHTVFVGNPGTGKTTVARIIAQIYRALGILERGHIIETDRQGMVAGYVGQTALKTQKKIDEATGGILFIDEAYALSGQVGVFADYGHEAIQTLLKRMEDDRGKFFIIAAGYPDNMKKFLNSNPGLKSRFDKLILFSDYSSDELFQIAINMFQDVGLRLSTKSRSLIKVKIQEMHQSRDRHFGNAREIRKMVKEITVNQHLRLAGQRNEDKKSDVNIVVADDINLWSGGSEKEAFNQGRIGFNKRN